MVYSICPRSSMRSQSLPAPQLRIAFGGVDAQGNKVVRGVSDIAQALQVPLDRWAVAAAVLVACVPL